MIKKECKGTFFKHMVESTEKNNRRQGKGLYVGRGIPHILFPFSHLGIFQCSHGNIID